MRFILSGILFLLAQVSYGQRDHQMIIDPSMSKDTQYIMLSDTNSSSPYYGRGMFVKYDSLTRRLATYINGLDTAYVNSGDSLVLVIAGDTTFFEGGSGSGLTDGNKGDVIVTGSGLVWDIATGVIADNELSNGLNVTQLADGTVTNTEFQYINSVTSNVQTQLDGKLSVEVDGDPTNELQDLSGLAIDANVVHKTGDETVSGEKTFNDSVKINDPILLYNSNFSNRYAVTQKSAKNTGATGYMAHQNIIYDSLAFPAMNDPYGRLAEWIEVSSWDSTINVGFENGGNLLHDEGFNLDQSSPRYNPKRPSYKKSIEQSYYPGSGNTLWVEGHEEVTDTLGRMSRPFDWYSAYDGSSAGFSTTSDYTTVYQGNDQETGVGYWELWDYANGTHKQRYSARTQIDKKYSGVLLEKYSNVISSAYYRNILSHDSNDRLLVGDTTGIDIQNRLTFRTNGYPVPLIKSNNYNIKFDTCLVEFLGENSTNRNFMLSKTGDADKMLFSYDGSIMNVGKYNANEAIFRINQAANNYSLNIASDSKIRINMNAGYGGVDFTQYSDDLAGGWMTRDAASAYYVGNYIDGSNDWVWNMNGSEKYKFKSTGQINALEYDATPPTGTAFGLLAHEADGDIISYDPALKVSVSDTSSMLSHYIEIQDTASMLTHFIERSDTAAMLSHYLDRASAETIYGVKTFNADPIVPAEAYAVGWDGSNEPPTKNDVYDKLELFAAGTGIDHGGLTGLADDDHTIYAKIAGRSGGQTLIGGTGTTDDLILQSTSGVGATGALIQMKVGNNGGTIAQTILNNGLVGIGTASPVNLTAFGGSQTNPLWVSSSALTGLVVQGTTGQCIQFVDNTSNTPTADFGYLDPDVWFVNRKNGGDILFATYPSGVLTYSLTIGGNNKMGINTRSEDKALEINLGTSDALRLSYNDNNGSAATYVDQSLSSTGVVTNNAVGSASSFVFTDPFANTATSLTLGAAAATFALTSNVMTITGNGGGNTLATITAGFSGQILTLIFADANVTITDDAAGTSGTINLSAAFTSTANDVMTLVHNGTSWREVSRSVN